MPFLRMFLVLHCPRITVITMLPLIVLTILKRIGAPFVDPAEHGGRARLLSLVGAERELRPSAFSGTTQPFQGSED